MVFRSLVGQKEYKAAFRLAERWLMVVVLPASVNDALSQRLVDSAASLVSLRHGCFASVGDFRQLDPIFRALEAFADMAPDPFSFLGQLMWHPLATDWAQVIQLRMEQWHKGWSGTARPALAEPQGFSLFLDGKVMASSLDDRAFSAALQLLVMEGKQEAKPRPESPASDVRCHSLFLNTGPEGLEPLPSHQYSILQKGPWLLFVLWNMANLGSVSSGALPASQAKAMPSDPFGVDLSLELLASLPLPPDAGAGGPSGRPSTSETKKRPSLSLPYTSSLFKPAERKSADTPKAVQRPTPCLYAMDLPCLKTDSAESSSTSFASAQSPASVSVPRLPQGLRCPVLAAQIHAKKALDWTAAEYLDFLPALADTDWLWRCHASRRASWSKGPGRMRRHVLVDILRGESALDKIWGECLGDSDLRHQHQEPADPKAKKTEATLLGAGEPWRFQEGGPHHLRELPGIVSAASMHIVDGCRMWLGGSVIFEVARTEMAKGVASPGHRVLFAVSADDAHS